MTRSHLPLFPGIPPLFAYFVIVLSACFLLGPLSASAQGTIADYRRALEMDETLDDTVVNSPGDPHWLEDSPHFWYRKSVEGGNSFVLVNAEQREKQPAFDHERLATTLTDSIDGESYTSMSLPFWTFRYTEGREAIEFEAAEASWRCNLDNYACGRTEESAADSYDDDDNWCGWLSENEDEDPDPMVSPNGGKEAFIRNHDVYVRPTDSTDAPARALSYDGAEGDAYTNASIAWSPNGEKLAVYRVDEAPTRMVNYVVSSPDDQLQPETHSCPYPKPGDELDDKQPVLFDVESGQKTVVDDSLFPDAYSMSDLEWWDDGRGVTFEYNQRGHQVYRVIEVDAETGHARALISEEPETFFDYSSKQYRYDVGDGDEIIWMSERSGWNHLYLYDGRTGEVKNQITDGKWVVRGVDHVDEENRQIYFHASGRHEGKDPYFVHYYRVNFDGTGLTALTDAHGTHEVTHSPDHKYYVNTWSRVDQPPVSQLRRTQDGEVLMTLEEADASALYDTGWSSPEVFTAKARDDSTTIWGVIVRPMDFDPDKKYPVIERIYAGPHGAFVPKSFSTLSSMQALAELGFIVVQIDGMGTNYRSKDFHDVAWKDLADAGFPDRIKWHKAAAREYPSYDTSRVGIYGTSAGGQSALGALLFHPEFYDAAVAASGAHNNRMDKIWWNEQWMGKIGPHYAASSNVEHADNLQGELLMIVGEVDRNVPPTTTLQVADALIEAGKTFDLLFMPGRGHTSGGEYGEVKRFDFFVDHLLGIESPNWNDPVNENKVPLPWDE
jgi:dipeptidyl aminopeptidase/acylaminoacyl peptidase